MLGFDDDDDALRIQDLGDSVGDLRGQTLLDLGAPRIALDEARELRQAGDDAAARNVAHMRAPVEGQEVVFAHRVEGDVAHEDEFIGARVELRTQMLTGVLEQAGAHFAPRACHAVGRADQAFTLGVFADGDKQVARGLFHGCGIVGHSCSSSTPEAPMTSIGDTSIPCTGTGFHSSSALIPTGLPRRAPGTAASAW